MSLDEFAFIMVQWEEEQRFKELHRARSCRTLPCRNREHNSFDSAQHHVGTEGTGTDRDSVEGTLWKRFTGNLGNEITMLCKTRTH